MVTGEGGWGGERAIVITLQGPQKNPVKTNKAAGFLNAQKGWHLARAAGEDETERSKGL